MAMLKSPSIVCVMPDKLGGALNIIEGVFRHRRPDAFTWGVVLTHNPLQRDTRFGGSFNADHQAHFEFRTPVEHLHAVLRRLEAVIPPGDGVLLVNDLLELALASATDCGRTVIQMLHGDSDYYYDLAARHEDAVDAFVTYAPTVDRKLRERLPHRTGDMYLLPYGLAEPPRRRASAAGPLRLIFAGRLSQEKGVSDLPLIDRALEERGVDVSWTVVGAGPEEQALRAAWNSRRVTFLGAKTTSEVLDIESRHDVFVLPTRTEGMPVALLEAMSVGLASVVSDIEPVAAVVTDGTTGLMPPLGNIDAFADAIAALNADRAQVESIGAAASQYVLTHHNLRERTDAYQALFARYRELKRPRPASVAVPYGSRLDQPWLPNFAVRAVRTAIRRAKGKPA
jgi:glycosyltransferase involved in cell wall biosynthesis